MTIYSGTIKLRRGQKATWESENPSLKYGEMAIVWDGTTPKLKVGNADEDPFNSLPWLGTEGPQGEDGDSAYDVAVANGFVGSEVDWLLSLIGEEGPPGPPGEDGQDGDDAQLAIGSDVTAGTAHAMLYVDVNGKLAQDPANFNYNSSTQILTLNGGLLVNNVAVNVTPVSSINVFIKSSVAVNNALVVKGTTGQTAAVFRILSDADVRNIDVFNNGDINFRGASSSRSYLASSDRLSIAELTANGNNSPLFVMGNNSGSVSVAMNLIRVGRTATQRQNVSHASGTVNGISYEQDFIPTSGSGIYNAFHFINTINQTGGANGITRAIYINPTLTSAADFRAIEVAAGKVVLALPTSSVGLPTGALWNDSGTVKIV